MNVILKTNNNAAIKICNIDTINCSGVKRIIQRLYKFRIEQQIILYNNNILNDDYIINDTIKDNFNNVILELKLIDYINIIVKPIITNDIININVLPNDQIIKLKNILCIKFNININNIKLVFNNTILNNYNTFDYYNIINNSEIKLFINMKSAPIFIKN